MKKYNPKDVMSFGISVKEFGILHDVLWQIEESREYEGEDYEALIRLQAYFSWVNNQDYSNYKGE